MPFTAMLWSTIVTEAHEKSLRSLHPNRPGRRGFYLLKNARHPEARRLLWDGLVNRVRLGLGLRHPPSMIPACVDPLRWLEPGDVLLNAGGAELFWLEKAAERLIGGPAPVIAYCSDRMKTAQFGYHPVETVWLLEQIGYCVLCLGPTGPEERSEGWYDAQSPGSWLLAVPPGRAIKEAGL